MKIMHLSPVLFLSVLMIIIIIIEIFIQVKTFSMPEGTVINKGPV